MSSEEDLNEVYDDVSKSTGRKDGQKKRKVARACDACRRRKIKCDYHNLGGLVCTHCRTNNAECTFIQGAPKRGPPKGFIDDLMKRCDRLEELVRKLAPDLNLELVVGPKFTLETWATLKDSLVARGSLLNYIPRPDVDRSRDSDPLVLLPHSPAIPSSAPATINTNLGLKTESNIRAAESDDDEVPSQRVECRLKDLTIDGMPKRFQGGKSSGMNLFREAVNLKREVEGTPANKPRERILRPKYWKPCPWEVLICPSRPSPASFNFPPEDLEPSLIDLCFTKALILYPIVHRPSFERDLGNGLHKTDLGFARMYLLVCALGARYSHDERVTLKPQEENGKPGDIQWTSAGWLWFSQVMYANKPVLAPAGLVDVQAIALAAVYLQGASAAHLAWLTAGLGLRRAQNLGCHREMAYDSAHPFQNQMWKRVFWSLLAVDRLTSSVLGRPFSVFDEDIDISPPLEVDDEHWNPDTKEWKQPPSGRPLRMAAFIQFIKLIGILAYAVRTIYSINKSKLHLHTTEADWEADIVAELDSSLNNWLDNLPDHLKWDRCLPANDACEYAALLRLLYHYVQITIHRPFIPALSHGRKSSPLSLPSLAICTNAARSAANIIDDRARKGRDNNTLSVTAAFTSGAVLLISIWGVQKTGLYIDIAGQIADVEKCLNELKTAEKRWHFAGKLCDILTELVSSSNVPLSQRPSPPRPESKRQREDDDTPEHIVFTTSTSQTAPGTILSASTEPSKPPGSTTNPSLRPIPPSESAPPPTLPNLVVYSAAPVANPTGSMPWPPPLPVQSYDQGWTNYPLDGLAVSRMYSDPDPIQLDVMGLSSTNGFGNIPQGGEVNVLDLFSGFGNPQTQGNQLPMGSILANEFGQPGSSGLNAFGSLDWNWMSELGLFGLPPQDQHQPPGGPGP